MNEIDYVIQAKAPEDVGWSNIAHPNVSDDEDFFYAYKNTIAMLKRTYPEKSDIYRGIKRQTFVIETVLT